MSVIQAAHKAPLPQGGAVHAGRRQPTPLTILNRIAAAFLGGYVFTWGFVVCSVAALTVAGVDFHEAEHAVMLLAFVVFLPVFLWAFAGRSLARIWAVLAGGGATMTVAAWLLQRSLLG